MAAKNDYTEVVLPQELLISFAKFLASEITEFYNNDEGKVYFRKWLEKYPEYDA